MVTADDSPASQAGRRIPERMIPAPASISTEAQAAINTTLPPLPPLPAPDDKEAWRSMIGAMNSNLSAMFEAATQGDSGTVVLETIGGVPVYVGTPETTPTSNGDKAAMFFHGGALVMAGGECVRPIAMLEAGKTGCRTYAVDFRNPPDHPYPAALDDGVAVYRALLERHGPERIVITGASGGGNLAIAVPLKARQMGLPLPAAIGVFSPQVDLTESGDSFQTILGIDSFGGGLAPFNALYAGDHDLADPYLSPLFADFSGGFPPTFIQSGTRDTFLSNAVRLHRTLRNAGVEAELHVGEAMPHGGFGMGLIDLPEDRELRLEFRKFLATHAGFAAQ